MMHLDSYLAIRLYCRETAQRNTLDTIRHKDPLCNTKNKNRVVMHKNNKQNEVMPQELHKKS